MERYTIIDGRRINILVEGRLINLASAEYMATNADKLEKRVCSVPGEIDRAIARLKLEAMGLKTDVLTEEQVMNRGSWEEGL